MRFDNCLRKRYDKKAPKVEGHHWDSPKQAESFRLLTTDCLKLSGQAKQLALSVGLTSRNSPSVGKVSRKARDA